MHSISVVLADYDIVQRLEAQFSSAKAVALCQNIGLVPLTVELSKEMTELTNKSEIVFEEFPDLNEAVVDVLLELSQLGKVAYVETEYFGGTGVQSSVVWENGRVRYGPKSSTSSLVQPINEALKILGVVVHTTHDEFDELGLGKNRTTEK